MIIITFILYFYLIIINSSYIFNNLSIKFCQTGGFRSIEEPHQKLIVIDGLLAFKGSANLTQTAWRSAENNMDVVEIVTDVDEVIKLHNRYFSPIWAKMSEVGDSIEILDTFLDF